ncbi:MAG TPA: hypothetical protein PK109_01505 [Candidatus Paceibacterota bacterium]|nr:hypothetical protein [Candidatus Paceibacterota bacterium]
MLKKVFTIFLYLFAAIGLFLVAGYAAVRLGLTNETGIIDVQRESFLGGMVPTGDAIVTDWHVSEEWLVLDGAIRRDEAVVKRAAADAGVSPRLILANLVAEQLRLFFTEREAYKQFFYPLKILGPQTQFSWGVMGMKEDTALQVEANLKNTDSPFYLGPQYEHALDFAATTTDIKTARFVRMTDQHDHYWSYLYAGLYMKQIEAQWRKAGYALDGNVAVISTLYNIGFANSVPKATPSVGGAAIQIGDKTYSFGGLAVDFYESNLLIDIFPR